MSSSSEVVRYQNDGGRIVEDWMEVEVEEKHGALPVFLSGRRQGRPLWLHLPYKIDFLNHDSGRSPGGDLPEKPQMDNRISRFFFLQDHQANFFLSSPLSAKRYPYGAIYPRIQAFPLFASFFFFHNHVFISFFPFSRSLALCPLRSPRGVVRRRWMNPIRLDSTAVIDSGQTLREIVFNTRLICSVLDWVLLPVDYDLRGADRSLI